MSTPAPAPETLSGAPLARQARARCPNCGSPAWGRYCATCGQRQDRRLTSMPRMVAEALEDQLSLGAALPRTVAALLLHPGFLTSEYLAGRIARYIPPLRLYLVLSLAFFFAVSWHQGVERAFMDETDDDPGVEATAPTPSGPAATGRDSSVVDRRGRINLQIDTTDASRLDAPVRRRVQHQIARINGMQRGEFQRRFFLALQASAPKAVFLLLPIYALILKLLYIRRRRLYAEHFVFGLHVHAFVFLIFTLLFLTPDWLDNLLLLVWVPAYIFIAMRRVYRQSVGMTFLKYGALFILYNTALIFVLVVTALLAAFTV